MYSHGNKTSCSATDQLEIHTSYTLQVHTLTTADPISITCNSIHCLCSRGVVVDETVHCSKAGCSLMLSVNNEFDDPIPESSDTLETLRSFVWSNCM